MNTLPYSHTTAADTADAVIALFHAHGDEAYLGEPVSQTEHALQAAHFAERDGATPEMIVAALVHDIGHLLHGLPEDIADQGIDSMHEEVGAHWIAARFGPMVAEAMRLHVDAKRYLCAASPGYHDALSPASRQSLALQGGPMSPEEVLTFEGNPAFGRAVMLRRWDDLAKIPGMLVPDLEHYRACLETVAAVAAHGEEHQRT